MNIIEQANKRLEELKRSGVEVPVLSPRSPAARGAAQNVQDGGHRDHLADGDKVPSRGSVAQGNEVVERRAAAAGHARPSLSDLDLDDKLKSPNAASASSRSIPVSIDLERLARMGYLIPDQSRTELASQFRHIKRPLLRNVDRESSDPSNRTSLIMVTSAIAGEGKTFCSINLAMSIAMEVDTSVLLIDADVVRPAVLDRLGLPSRPGLLDLLAGDVTDVSEVLLRTNVPKLSILPAGAPRAMATELLASVAMDKLLIDLATRYPDRVVILDAPPLLLTTESPVLASRVGQVVVVVDSSKTNTHKVAQAFATVETCPIVLSLLNKCRSPSKTEGYGYGYK